MTGLTGLVKLYCNRSKYLAGPWTDLFMPIIAGLFLHSFSRVGSHIERSVTFLLASLDLLVFSLVFF